MSTIDLSNASDAYRAFVAQASSAPGPSQEELAAMSPAQYVESLRKNAAGISFLWPDVAGVRVAPLAALTADVGVVWCEPATASADSPVLVYIHGGGFVCCDAASYGKLGAQWAARTGARVALLDYPLMPEHDWPLDALVAAVEAVRRGTAARVALAGDSSGATLALQVCRELGERGAPPACCVAISPIVDVSLSDESTLSFDETASLSVKHTATAYAQLRRALVDGAHGLGERARRDPRVSPAAWTAASIESATRAPLWLCTGRAEALYPGVRTLVGRLPQSRVTLLFGESPPMLHAWPNVFQHFPEAERALSDACAFVKRALHEA